MQVDSFTSEAFKGNPAAVCLLSSPLDDAHLQRIASEVNLSETAYVEPVTATAGAFHTHSHFKLRWFTPKSEVPLCGHATLAAAAILSSGKCNAHAARPQQAGHCLDFHLCPGISGSEQQIWSCQSLFVYALHAWPW